MWLFQCVSRVVSHAPVCCSANGFTHAPQFITVWYAGCVCARFLCYGLCDSVCALALPGAASAALTVLEGVSVNKFWRGISTSAHDAGLDEMNAQRTLQRQTIPCRSAFWAVELMPCADPWTCLFTVLSCVTTCPVCSHISIHAGLSRGGECGQGQLLHCRPGQAQTGWMHVCCETVHARLWQRGGAVSRQFSAVAAAVLFPLSMLCSSRSV